MESHALLRHVTWDEVLPRLGIDIPLRLLPTMVTCPLCRGSRLHIYQDSVADSQWHFCEDCHRTGDMIELAAAAWKISPEAAVLKLAAQGVPIPGEDQTIESIERYEQLFPQRRARINALWEESRRSLARRDSEKISQLLRRSKLQFDPFQWSTRGGRFLGATTRKQVDEALYPSKPVEEQTPQQRRRGFNRASAYHLPGKGWRDMLVIPMWMLPGKLRSLLFIGREGDLVKDVCFRTLGRQPRTPAGVCEAGLSMLETLLEPTPQFGDAAFIIDGPITALRMQLRHLRDTGETLPLCGTYGRGCVLNRDIWQHFFQRQFIFWGPRVTPELMRQAIYADGCLATEASLQEIVSRPSRQTPARWLERIQRAARPWQTVLSEYIAQHPWHEAEQMLLLLHLDSDMLMQFAATQPPQTRAQLERMMDHVPAARRQVVISNRTIYEDQRGWVVNDREVVCDTPLRVERVVRQPETDETTYTGYLRGVNRNVPFTAPAEEVDPDVYGWMQRTLLDAGEPLPTVIGRWKTHLWTLALRFHQPEYLLGTDRFGWDHRRRRFVFPEFEIDGRGQVHDGSLVHVLDRTTPATGLRPPEDFTDEEAAVLCNRSVPVSLFWAVAACVLHNLLGDVFGWTTSGIGLHGDGAVHGGPSAAQVLGCTNSSLLRQAVPAHKSMERAHQLSEKHGWPLVLERARDRHKSYRSVLADDRIQNCMVEVGDYAALALMINGGWHVVECHSPIRSLQALLPAGRKIVPAFLQDLGRNRFELPPDPHPLRRVLFGLAAWFESCGGASHPVTEASKLLRIPDECDPLEAFLDLACWLYIAGDLRAAPPGFDKDGQLPDLVVADGQVSLSKNALARALAAHQAPMPDLVVVEQALLECGALLQDTDNPQRSSWQLPESFWRDAILARQHFHKSGRTA